MRRYHFSVGEGVGSVGMVGTTIINNVDATLRDGRINAIHPPTIRTTGRRLPLVTWTLETRERVLVLVDAAVGAYEGAMA